MTTHLHDNAERTAAKTAESSQNPSKRSLAADFQGRYDLETSIAYATRSSVCNNHATPPPLLCAHVLRKYEPAQWGGTETALQRLLNSLRVQNVEGYLYAPRLDQPGSEEPLSRSCLGIRRFRSVVPVAKISRQQRQRLVSLGGNLLSWQLPWQLWNEPRLDIIHSHTLGRLAGTARAIASLRRIPFVLTIHGGALDLPDSVRAALTKPLEGGWEWGKIFGALVRSRQILRDADGIITINPREAELLRAQYPGKRVLMLPHGVPLEAYARDQREAAYAAFPHLRGRDVLLSVGRIDRVKNQTWLVRQMPDILRRFPNAHLVLAGACTDEDYGRVLKETIAGLGLGGAVTVAGNLPQSDGPLVGLYQAARLVLLASVAEPFGLVILESWASGTPVLSTRTSGAASLIEHGRTGWLFDVDDAPGFIRWTKAALSEPAITAWMIDAARQQLAAKHDTRAVATKVRELYETLIEEKRFARKSESRKQSGARGAADLGEVKLSSAARAAGI
jgi:alpha-maltose-1-phosphate synthase